MISRRIFLAGAVSALPAISKQKLSIPMGLQIYSLRREAQKDLAAALAMIRKFGFDEVEVSALYGHGAAEFRRLLDNSGLKATSMMAQYEKLAKDISSVADDAHTLGVEYVVASTVPHTHKKMALDDIQRCSRPSGGRPTTYTASNSKSPRTVRSSILLQRTRIPNSRILKWISSGSYTPIRTR